MPRAGQKRILFDGLNIRWGGGLTVAKRVALGFRNAGHDVHIILNSQKLADVFDKEPGIKVHLPSGTASALGALKYRHGAFSRFEKILAPDVLFSFNYFTPSSTPQVTYHINTIPYLPLMERVKAVGWIRAFILRCYGNLALKNSRLNLFESRYLLDMVSAQAKIENPHIAYIGTDRAPSAISSDAENNDITIVTVTSGPPHKRNDLMLAAFRKFRATQPTARLKIIGEKDHILNGLSDSDRRYALESESIDCTGYVDRQTLFSILSNATCLVTFSELESFFMIAIEAMRVGCPVVGSDISSIRESVGDHALLFEPRNVDQAVEHMTRLVTADEAIDDDAARKWADGFDADACAAKIVQMVEEMEQC